MQHKLVIIAAGGTGSRLNANLPKQYMLLCNKPVLMHTIEAFDGIVDDIYIAIHPQMISYWENLCIAYNFNITHQVIAGGDSRFQSIKNTISHIATHIDQQKLEDSCIAVHDAARPLIAKELIQKSFELAQQGNNVTLAVKSSNSIRIGNQEISHSIDRNTVWQIQTPQTFPASELIEAYKQEEDPLFTDDCSVLEKLGKSIQILESTNNNIKLTFPEDFAIAEILINR